jgi:transcriptional regulator with XRE-family HTH domain
VTVTRSGTVRPALNKWAGRQILLIRERSGLKQEEFAAVLSQVMGLDQPLSRARVSGWERARNPIGADALLATYVASGLEPAEIARVVMEALHDLKHSDFLLINAGSPRRQQRDDDEDHEKAGIRDIVEGLQKVDDGANERKRKPRARPDSTASRGT